MKIKANKRPRMVRGMLSCRCCDDLYDKPYKLDKQMLKELLEDLNVGFDVADSIFGCDPKWGVRISGPNQIMSFLPERLGC